MKFAFLMMFAFMAVGIYLILCDFAHMPSLASTKAALKLTQGKKQRGYQVVTLRASNELAKHIHLDEYRRRTLNASLQYAEIALTPETYLSKSIVKAFSRLMLAIPCLFVIPIAAPIFVLWAISGFLDSNNEVKRIVAEKRGKIDEELPRFVSTISQELNASRDVLSILEGYCNSAEEVFKNELEITIAGMKSGSQEQALSRLSGRVGSAMLSQVVSGLLATLRGDNGVIYFALLANDFQKLDVQFLKKRMQKRPGEMKKFSYLLLGCLMAAYIYIMIKQMFGQAGSLFA